MHPKKDFETGPSQEEQRADSNIDEQLKVGPIHRGTVRMLASNGESWTCHSCTLLGMETQKHIDTIYISHVDKDLHWSSELKVLHEENLSYSIISVRSNGYIRI